MLRKISGAALALLSVAGLAVASDAKEASGTVKAVASDSITVTDGAAKDWMFAVDKDTTVLIKGGTHKLNKLKADGKPPTIGEFLTVEKSVVVKYMEKDGKMVAKEVRVK